MLAFRKVGLEQKNARDAEKKSCFFCIICQFGIKFSLVLLQNLPKD